MSTPTPKGITKPSRRTLERKQRRTKGDILRIEKAAEIRNQKRRLDLRTPMQEEVFEIQGEDGVQEDTPRISSRSYRAASPEQETARKSRRRSREGSKRVFGGRGAADRAARGALAVADQLGQLGSKTRAFLQSFFMLLLAHALVATMGGVTAIGAFLFWLDPNCVTPILSGWLSFGGIAFGVANGGFVHFAVQLYKKQRIEMSSRKNSAEAIPPWEDPNKLFICWVTNLLACVGFGLSTVVGFVGAGHSESVEHTVQRRWDSISAQGAAAKAAAGGSIDHLRQNVRSRQKQQATLALCLTLTAILATQLAYSAYSRRLAAQRMQRMADERAAVFGRRRADRRLEQVSLLHDHMDSEARGKSHEEGRKTSEQTQPQGPNRSVIKQEGFVGVKKEEFEGVKQEGFEGLAASERDVLGAVQVTRSPSMV